VAKGKTGSKPGAGGPARASKKGEGGTQPGDEGKEDPKGKPGKRAKKDPNAKPNPEVKEGGQDPGESGQGNGPGTKPGGKEGGAVTVAQPGTTRGGPGGNDPSGNTGGTPGKVSGGGQYPKPTAEQLAKLFRLGNKGRTSDQVSPGKARKNATAEAADAARGSEKGKRQESTDPAERAAALRLQMAIQRIQANRDIHRSQAGSNPGGGMATPIRKRDW
jgi:hypothetical protein